MNRGERPGTSESSTVPWEKVYLFISSTFNDMHAERDFLVKKVFPSLAEWCERRKLRMVDVDLRWGVTEEEATRNKNVVGVCLKRIDECRPFFLCFLGQRYGWVPRREDLSAATLREFPGLGEAVDGQHSVTELEILHALVRPFHPEDRIEERDFHPTRYTFFFLREDSYLENLPTEPAYLRRIYSDKAEKDDETRQFLLRKNRTLREETVRQSQQPALYYEAEWSQTAESPELALPLASPALLDENIAHWRRLWREAAGIEVEGEEVGPEQVAKAKAFNDSLTRGRLTGFRSDGHPLERVILGSLETAIAERFPDHVELEERGNLQVELDQQDQFLFVGSDGFIERQGDFDELDAYIEGDSDRMFVLTAPGGMGKSTLLASWISGRQDRFDREGGETLHYRFIGQSDGSTTVDSLLRLLLEELKEMAGKLDEEIPADPRELRQMWPELLAAVGSRGKTILVLDAINQLGTGLSDLWWLPHKLPAGIKIIASFKRGEAAAESLFGELSEEGEVHLAEVRPFGDLVDRCQLVEVYLSQYLKELDERHIDELIRSGGAKNPLFLKVVLSELRIFGVFASLGEKIREDFGTDPVTAFNAVLARLERDPAYSAFPPEEAVPILFGLLAHARRGLSAEELTDLFVQVLELEETSEAREAAADTIYLFLRQVRPFLARRDGRYDFFYESFQIAARDRFVGEATTEVPGRILAEKWHSLLADGFRSRSDPAGDGSWSGEPRGITEIPFHLAHARRDTELTALLMSLSYLDARCEARDCWGLLEDCRTLVPPAHREALAPCVAFLERHAQRLSSHANVLFGLVCYQGPDSLKLQAEELWRDRRWRKPWLKVTAAAAPPRAPAAPATGLLHTAAIFQVGSTAITAPAGHRRLCFFLERIGAIGILSLTSGQHLENRIRIRPDPILALAVSADGRFLAVAYEDAVVGLFELGFSETDDRLLMQRSRGDYPYLLPEFESPVLGFEDSGFFFQNPDGTVTRLDLGSGQPDATKLPVGADGTELSALAFLPGALFAAFRDGRDSILVLWAQADEPVVRRLPGCDVTAATSWGSNSVAVAASDQKIRRLEVDAGLAAVEEVEVPSNPRALVEGWDSSLIIVAAKGLQSWRTGSQPEPVEAEGLERLIPLCSIAVDPRRRIYVAGGGRVAVLEEADAGGRPAGRIRFAWQTGERAEDYVAFQQTSGEWQVLDASRRAKFSLTDDLRLMHLAAMDGRHAMLLVAGPDVYVVEPGLLTAQSVQWHWPSPIAALGDPRGGFWLAGGSGDLFYVSADFHAQLAITLPGGVHTAVELRFWGETLVWKGLGMTNIGDGFELLDTLAFIERYPDQVTRPPRLLGSRVFEPACGKATAMGYDPCRDLGMMVWQKERDLRRFLLRGTVEAFIGRAEEEVILSGLHGELSQLIMSRDGHHIYLMNQEGNLFAIAASDGGLEAVLAPEPGFTTVATQLMPCDRILAITDHTQLAYVELMTPDEPDQEPARR